MNTAAAPVRDRLDPTVLAEDAQRLLAINGDVPALIARLLKQVRENDDQQQAIRDGYGHSARLREECHQVELDAQRRHLASAIEREARRGDAHAPANAHLTYCGDPECCICADQPCTSVTADRIGRHQRAAAARESRWAMRHRPWDEAPF